MPQSKKFPTEIVLPKPRYTAILELAQWLSAWPDWLEMTDSQTDAVMERIESLLPQLVKRGFYVDVQIENKATAVPGVTRVGHLVALLDTDENFEVHVPIVLKEKR